MTKELLIKPENVLSRGLIQVSDIPVNVYQRTISEELHPVFAPRPGGHLA